MSANLPPRQERWMKFAAYLMFLFADREAIVTKESDEVQAKKRETIEWIYGQKFCEIDDVTHLSLTDAVFLASLTRHSLSEDYCIVKPFSDAAPFLAPTFEFQKDIVTHLYAKTLLAPSPNSPSDAFIFGPSLESIPEYYPARVTWSFYPGRDIDETQDFLTSLEALIEKRGEWPENWYEHRMKIWNQICKIECIEYYKYLLAQRNYEPETIGPKTHSVFDGLLDKFSVGQIMNLTWQAVRDTTDYIVKEDLPTYRAKNSFIGSIQRKADKYLAEGWELKNSRRDFNCPQSVISATYFNLFLGLGQSYFDTVRPNFI